MGETAADTQREIEEIRKDITSAVTELQNRVSRAVSPKTYLDFARENPAAILGVGLAGLGVAGTMLARSIAEQRRQNRPSERLKRQVRGAAEGLTSGLTAAAQQAYAALPSLPVEVRLGTHDADDDDTKPLTLPGSDPGMFKRVLWAALVAAMMALGGLAARRLSATIWRQAMGESPPTKNV